MGVARISVRGSTFGGRPGGGGPCEKCFPKFGTESTNFRRTLVDSVPNRLRIVDSVPNRLSFVERLANRYRFVKPSIIPSELTISKKFAQNFNFWIDFEPNPGKFCRCFLRFSRCDKGTLIVIKLPSQKQILFQNLYNFLKNLQIFIDFSSSFVINSLAWELHAASQINAT